MRRWSTRRAPRWRASGAARARRRPRSSTPRRYRPRRPPPSAPAVSLVETATPSPHVAGEVDRGQQPHPPRRAVVFAQHRGGIQAAALGREILPAEVVQAVHGRHGRPAGGCCRGRRRRRRSRWRGPPPVQSAAAAPLNSASASAALDQRATARQRLALEAGDALVALGDRHQLRVADHVLDALEGLVARCAARLRAGSRRADWCGSSAPGRWPPSGARAS